MLCGLWLMAQLACTDPGGAPHQPPAPCMPSWQPPVTPTQGALTPLHPLAVVALQTELGKFDQLVGNTISQLNTYCGALNCLNVTSMPPSQRNAAVNDNCVTAYPSKDCAGVTTWNPLAPTPCTYVDPAGSGSISGVCDADGEGPEAGEGTDRVLPGTTRPYDCRHCCCCTHCVMFVRVALCCQVWGAGNAV